MTNRQEYTDKVYKSTPKEDVQTIRQHLKFMKKPVTLNNAKIVLALLISQAPGEWTLTLEELSALWASEV